VGNMGGPMGELRRLDASGARPGGGSLPGRRPASSTLDHVTMIGDY